MASNTLDDLLFTARAANSRAVDVAGTQTILYEAVVAAILTAVTAGLFTVTYDASAETDSKNLQWVIEELRHNGFVVTLAISDVIIDWLNV